MSPSTPDIHKNDSLMCGVKNYPGVQTLASNRAAPKWSEPHTAFGITSKQELAALRNHETGHRAVSNAFMM